MASPSLSPTPDDEDPRHVQAYQSLSEEERQARAQEIVDRQQVFLRARANQGVYKSEATRREARQAEDMLGWREGPRVPIGTQAPTREQSLVGDSERYYGSSLHNLTTEVR